MRERQEHHSWKRQAFPRRQMLSRRRQTADSSCRVLSTLVSTPSRPLGKEQWPFLWAAQWWGWSQAGLCDTRLPRAATCTRTPGPVHRFPATGTTRFTSRSPRVAICRVRTVAAPPPEAATCRALGAVDLVILETTEGATCFIPELEQGHHSSSSQSPQLGACGFSLSPFDEGVRLREGGELGPGHTARAPQGWPSSQARGPRPSLVR